MGEAGKAAEWTEASAGRVADFRRVYRRSVEDTASNEADRVQQINEMTGANLPPRTPASLPPHHEGDEALADKWKDSAGLHPTWMPTFPQEELLRLRHSQVLASSFVPQRHIRYILGRPVVVPRIHLIMSIPMSFC